MTGFAADLVSGVRQFARHRGLAVVALTSLAVGIGVSVAITSGSSAVLLRPLPYDRPEDLVMVWRRTPGASVLDPFWGARRTARQILTPGIVLRSDSM